MRKVSGFILLPLIISLAACSPYETRYVSFKPADTYLNKQTMDGITIAAESFAEKKAAEHAFGFDIRGAGALPVQLIMTNNSGSALSIVTSQTFLVDDSGQYWPLMSNTEAVSRIEKSTEYSSVGKSAGRGAAFGAAAGVVLGAAFGILTGSNVVESSVKGGVVGGAGGAVIGGSNELEDKKTFRKISDDLREKGLEGKTIPSEGMANGFIFFPGEAPSAKEVRVQLSIRGRVHTITIHLKTASGK